MIAYLLVLIGAMNWGFKAAGYDTDAVQYIGNLTDPMVAKIVYALVALSGLALAVVKIVKLAKKNKAY